MYKVKLIGKVVGSLHNNKGRMSTFLTPTLFNLFVFDTLSPLSIPPGPSMQVLVHQTSGGEICDGFTLIPFLYSHRALKVEVKEFLMFTKPSVLKNYFLVDRIFILFLILWMNQRDHF